MKYTNTFDFGNGIKLEIENNEKISNLLLNGEMKEASEKLKEFSEKVANLDKKPQEKEEKTTATGSLEKDLPTQDIEQDHE